MALPIVPSATYEVTLPFSKKTVNYRPYTVADEKLIIQGAMALRDNKDTSFYTKNVMKVIKSCLDGDPDNVLETLSFVDIEYLLIQIRSKSVGEVIEAKFDDPDTKKPVGATINLDEFVLVENPEYDKKIEITETIGIVMKDIPFESKLKLISNLDEKGPEIIYDVMVECVDYIYDENNIYRVGENTTLAEVKKFINDTVGLSPKLHKFISSMPILRGKIILDNGKNIDISGSEISFLLL